VVLASVPAAPDAVPTTSGGELNPVALKSKPLSLCTFATTRPSPSKIAPEAELFAYRQPATLGSP
jgi:hypothetical protein